MDDKIFAVADFFLANADPDDPITHLKLQKLCAYAKAFSLALNNEPLFSEHLEAWQHGPVVRRLYEAYRANGRNVITTTTSPIESRAPFTDEELYILETVNHYYSRFSAPELRNMTHRDFPGNFDSLTKDIIPDAEVSGRFQNNEVVKAIREQVYG